MAEHDTSRREVARSVEAGSREDILRHQSQGLRELATRMVRSGYWRERFAEVGFDPSTLRHPDDLHRAPTLDKHQYFTALSKDPQGFGGLLVSPLDDVRQAGAITYRTTGTSGKQGRFINTAAGFQVFADQGYDMMVRAGARPGDSILCTWPLSFWAASWGFFHGCPLGPFMVVPGGPPADTRMRLELMKEYRPSIVVLTPSYAVTLGHAAKAEGLSPPDFGVRGLLMGGETFGPAKRALIEDLWNLPGGARNFYGISEGGPLFAGECEAQDGLHLFEGDTIHQFWKPGTNQPAEPGEIAEHVFTSISQSAMATWFNFRTKDAARFTDEPCRCGRRTRRMWIMERLDDMVKVKGVNIFASGVEDLLQSIAGVGREFKLVLDTVQARDTLTLQVELDAGCDQAATSAIIKTSMTTAWGIHFDIECLAPGTLPRTEGKARRWQDRRPKDQ